MKPILILSVALLLTGCASTPNSNPKDPFESTNRKIYKFNDALDRNVLKPVAKGYNTVLPEPVKTLLRNFFSNLDDVTVTLNDLLQLKFKQAASDGSRVLFNSTFGIFGLLNVTGHLEKHNEDFGQTLGYWGVGSGPYLMLPFFGPSSIRDGVGLGGDVLTGVISNIPDIPTRNSLYATDKIRVRAELLDREQALDEASDRYAFIRDFYLARRQSLVYDGDPPKTKYIDEED
ncbi:MAG: hypothetical protein FD173_1735 [Gallionellaceae bacterium]|nr:MAG: hypothetical protein FD173_1735 [Gallionellaceae bacterium]